MNYMNLMSLAFVILSPLITLSSIAYARDCRTPDVSHSWYVINLKISFGIDELASAKLKAIDEDFRAYIKAKTPVPAPGTRINFNLVRNGVASCEYAIVSRSTSFEGWTTNNASRGKTIHIRRPNLYVSEQCFQIADMAALASLLPDLTIEIDHVAHNCDYRVPQLN